jgi:hypothetical protein
MGEAYRSSGLGDGQFDKARWSMVSGVVKSRGACAQKALAEFCGNSKNTNSSPTKEFL